MSLPPAPRRLLLLAGVLGSLLPGGGVPAAAEEPDGLPGFLAPLRADLLARQGKAVFRHSDADLGAPGDAFDGRPETVLRTRAANPAFLEVTFDRPREVVSATAYFAGGAPHEWSLLAGDDPDGLRVLFARHRVPADSSSPIEALSPTVKARVFRVVAKRLDGGDSVQFGEVVLMAMQKPERLEVVAPSPVVCPSGSFVLRARIWFDGGHRSGAADGLAFETPKSSPLLLEPLGRDDPTAVTARFGEAGTTRVRAYVPGRSGFRLESPWQELECRSEGRPDWSVGWIERAPRLPCDGPGGGLPGNGDTVLYRAHVKNYGTVDAPRAACRWELDGKPVESGSIDEMRRFAGETREVRLPWDGRRHDVRFVVDPDDAVAETSEGNNSVTIQSDALRLGFWVERPVLDWFHRAQPSFGDGANGWEDWAQRQVARWNRMLAGAKYPLTPAGVVDRVALDLVVEAPEGALPLRGGTLVGDPDAADRTVDLRRGFPAALLDGDAYRRTGEKRDDNPLWFDGPLLRGLSRARGLVDLEVLDVARREVDLPGADFPADAEGCVHRSRSGVMMRGLPAGGYGPHEAFALQRIAGLRARRGDRGAPQERGGFLADLPHHCGIRVLASDGRPLGGAAVRAWRRSPGTGGSDRFGGAPAREGETVDGGVLDLSPGGRDPFFDGRRTGPFDAGQGVLVLEISRGGRSCWRVLEIVPFNMACWRGETTSWFEDVATDLPR